MNLEIKDDSYYVGIWFLGDGETIDWMAVVEREATGDHVMHSRFRYYDNTAPDPRDPFNGRDEKRGLAAKFPAGHSEELVIRVVDDLIETLIRGGIQPYSKHKLLVGGGGRRFIEVLSQAPFAHMGPRTEPVPNTQKPAGQQ